MNTNDIQSLVKKTKQAAPLLAILSTATKNRVLRDIAKALQKNSERVLKENQKDIQAARDKGLNAAMVDRLLLTQKRIDGMAKAILDVVKLADPVGNIVESRKRGGLNIKRVRIPLGVVGIIYESRPNVTVDAAVLCFKSGNAVILRGGSEAFYSNSILVVVIGEVLKKYKIDSSVVTFIPFTDREAMVELLQMEGDIDVIIPRGGEGLMRFIKEHSKIPVIKHDKGVCGIFVDDSADVKKSLKVIHNAKVHRPGVCNALETLYVHEKIAAKFLPLLHDVLTQSGVEIRGDERVRQILPQAKTATEEDYATEYLDLILAIKTVKNVDDAIVNIRKYYSHHTESILTQNKKNAQKFVDALDSSCVMVNTSTRFNDGGELGLGAEIGISTTKLHAYGPMGLKELTTTKFVVTSNYQVRK